MSYPWTGIVPSVFRVRTAEEGVEELARLRKLAAAETDFDAVVLATEDRLASSHVAATLSEATSPAEALVLSWVRRETDEILGPGRNLLHVLTARHPPLRASMHRMRQYLTMSDSLIGDASRKLVLARMDAELAAFAQVRKGILDAATADVEALSKELAAAVGPEVGKAPRSLTASQLRDECARSLDEAARDLAQLRAAAGRGARLRAAGEAAARRGRDEVRALAAGRTAGRTADRSYRVRAVARFGDPLKLGSEFAGRVKQRLGVKLPVLKEIEDAEVFFAEALGVAASAKDPKLLRRYVENRASLTTKELERVQGFLGGLRGLLPEEAAVRMQFLQGVFSKRAFEAMEAFPPQVRGLLTVEMVNGPLWVDVGRGAKRQFGDGCLLLTGPGGESAIIGLGEFKAGFDEDLLQQLFVRSDGRAVTASVEFIAVDGSRQTRKLTREFTIEGSKPVRMTEPPLYIYGRPAGESAETAEKFKAMVKSEMSSGRQMWKVQLPFTTGMNAEFANVALEEAVRTLVKTTSWGH